MNHEQLLNRHALLKAAWQRTYTRPELELAVSDFETVTVTLPFEYKIPILNAISLELAPIERTLSEPYFGKSWDEVKELVSLNAQLAEIDKELENLHAKQSELRSKLEALTGNTP